MMASKTGRTTLVLFCLLASAARAQLPALCPPTRPNPGDPCPAAVLYCVYDYVDASCEEGISKCISTTYAACDSPLGWNIMMTAIGCQGAPEPPGFGATCDPYAPPLCPPTRPDPEDPCPVDGQQCEYNYVDASCEEGISQCIPTAYASCDANMGWMIMMASLPRCPEGAPEPPGFGAPCDPDAPPLCPPARPEPEDPCPVDGQQCEYDFVDASCEEGISKCIPVAYASCDASIGWMVAMAAIGCFGEPEPPNFGMPCDPDSPPLPIEVCPETAPENGGTCITDGYAAGLSCQYGHSLVGCDAASMRCAPQAFFDCDESDEWFLAVPDYFCDGGIYPDNFLDPCDPSAPVPPPTTPAPTTMIQTLVPESASAANTTIAEDTNIETTITEEDSEEEAPAEASSAARRIARDGMAAVLGGSWLASLLLQLA